MLACSRRSDSGERCEVKRGAKKAQFPSTFHRFFTSHRSPVSARLEQAAAVFAAVAAQHSLFAHIS